MAKSLLLLLLASTAFAQHEFTVYELQAPETHKFAIIYDVMSSTEGAAFYLNPIRKGSKAFDERVIDVATGKELKFEIVNGEALKVYFAQPIPKLGVARFRIYKTYEDAASYSAQGDRIVFDRPLGVRRNVIVLPAGYELIGSSVPSIVSTQPDGRVRISMLNDRDDQLPVKITGRKLP
ncbi:MAG TPA: hypothetical protein VGP62_25230 [Bryobacteraceae bacterium]|nr:hypothetical protein [Bryobacteraceae bacterium]